jgi:3-oxoadipate enol-lactonase
MPSLERPDGNIHYDIVDIVPPWIERPATILFHHGVSTTLGIWSDWIPVLAERYRIVRFDMRGYGRSSVPPPDFPWSFELLVDDLIAVADAAAAATFHLVGESLGGTAALVAALRHPERVSSLTVSNGTHRGPAIRNVRGQWGARIAGEGQEAWAREMMEHRFFPGALADDKFRWFLREHATCSAAATLGLAELLLRTDLCDEVAAVRCPTLLLAPDSSPFIPVALMSELRDRLPDAELQVFAHARHGLPLSHGRECAETLRAFLRRRFG